MPVGEGYRKQVALLIKTAPFVAAEKAFALKGGTAINLFVRDMPRLSVEYRPDLCGGCRSRDLAEGNRRRHEAHRAGRNEVAEHARQRELAEARDRHHKADCPRR